MMAETIQIGKRKQDFPALRRKVHEQPLVYLDNAATTQKPRQVLDAMRDYYEQHNANVHRGIHQLSQEATELYDEAHKTAADFINASSMEEMIFTRNATESLNLVAYSLLQDMKRGDEIVVTEMEHHSNFVPWQQLAEKHGLTLRSIPVTGQGELDYSEAEQLITDKTKIVAFSHVSNTLGTINDAKRLIKLARENDAYSVVDAAQSAPHLKLDVKKLGADFLAFSGHKMLAPMGIGALYGKKEHLESMRPFLYGGDMIREVSLNKTTFNDLPWKFEAGTPNVGGAAGLKAAIEYVQGIGMDTIEKEEREIVEYTDKKLAQIDGLTAYGPAKRAAVFSFNYKDVHPHDVASLLDTHGIAVRSGHHCTMPLMQKFGIPGTCRASFSVYNTKEDADTLVDGLTKAQKVFS